MDQQVTPSLSNILDAVNNDFDDTNEKADIDMRNGIIAEQTQHGTGNNETVKRQYLTPSVTKKEISLFDARYWFVQDYPKAMTASFEEKQKEIKPTPSIAVPKQVEPVMQPVKIEKVNNQPKKGFSGWLKLLFAVLIIAVIILVLVLVEPFSQAKTIVWYDNGHTLEKTHIIHQTDNTYMENIKNGVE